MNEQAISKIKKHITDFLYEEEGNITRNKVLLVGSMMLVMGAIMSIDAYAAHSSHESHSSHSSHSSHTSGAYHRSHTSHSSHSSHSNTHSSHSSHSNTTYTTHYSIDPSAPSMEGIALQTPPATPSFVMNESLKTQFILPDTPKMK